MKQNGAVRPKSTTLIQNDFTRLKKAFGDAKDGTRCFVIYDSEKIFRILLKELRSIEPKLSIMKFRLSQNTQKFWKKLCSNTTAPTLITHFQIDYEEDDRALFYETLSDLDRQFDSAAHPKPVWLFLPFSQIPTVQRYAPGLWEHTPDKFLLESRDIDRHRTGFYLIDHFANTHAFRFIDQKIAALSVYQALLDNYLRSLTEEFIEEAEVIFSLQGKIAALQYQMGQYGEALHSLEKQGNLLKLLRNDKLLPELLNNIGVVQRNIGRYREAEGLLERAMKAAEKRLRGAHHPGKIIIASNQGALAADLGYHTKAFVLTRQALRMGESKLGMRSEGLLPLLLKYSRACRERGEHENALDQYRRGLKIVEARLSIDHPYMSIILQHIGMVYYDQKRYDLAQRYVYRTLEVMERSLGPEHPYLGRLFNNIGVTHLHGEHHQLALGYFNWALDIRHKAVGPNDPVIGMIHNNIAQAYTAQGDSDSAQICYHKAYQLLSQYLPETHRELQSIQTALNALAQEVPSE